MKFMVLCLLISLAASEKCIALVHGMGGKCESYKQELEYLQNKFKTKAICINKHGENDSLHTKIEEQSHEAYQNLKDSGCKTVYLIAISQGAVIANYIIANQKLIDFKVKGLTTFGGVNRGIHSVKDSTMNFGMSLGNLFSWAVDFSFQSYTRSDKGPSFFSDAKFLRTNINDRKRSAIKVKMNFLDLDKVIIVGYSNENMFNPYETAYYLWADANGKRLAFEDDPFFRQDKLGILAQFLNGKLEVFEFQGNHGKHNIEAFNRACNKMLFPVSNKRDLSENLSEIFDEYVKMVDKKVNINGRTGFHFIKRNFDGLEEKKDKLEDDEQNSLRNKFSKLESTSIQTNRNRMKGLNKFEPEGHLSSKNLGPFTDIHPNLRRDKY